jgi:RNA-directed DNA polymerase
VLARDQQPELREEQAGPHEVAERFVVAKKPGNAGGAKGPQFKASATSDTTAGRLTLRLAPPEKVGTLQTALHTKAKQSPNYRFYALYDKVYRPDVLEHAYRLCRANDGKPGVDGQSFRDIQEYGEARWLGELAEELQQKEYQPQPVRRVYLPKPDGKQRPLGIPTIKDRVVQTAALLVLEPIFEADLQDEQYAYRPGRSAQDAIEQVGTLLRRGHTEVVDADLSGYFDSIPHAELMKSVARRVSDGRMLRLIKMWLEAPVEESDQRGRRRRTTRNKDEGRGTPQGAPISPLLSNLYMRRFILGWKTMGHEKRLAAKIVNYADDFVILCPRGRAERAMTAMRDMMQRLRLTVNEQKTRRAALPEETFDFLGYRFGRLRNRRTGRAYYGQRPSAKSLKRLRRRIHEETSRQWLWRSEESRVEAINRMLRGWANYFSVGTIRRAYSSIDHYVFQRLRQWWCAKHKVRNRRDSRFSSAYVYRQLGLVRLSGRRKHPACAKV